MAGDDRKQQASSGSDDLSVLTRNLRPFEPANLGPYYPIFGRLLGRIANLKQSDILRLLRREIDAFANDDSTNAIAYRLTLSVLADYVTFGNYPIVAGGRCLLANVLDTATIPDEKRRTVHRRLFCAARDQAMSARNQSKWLESTVEALRKDPPFAREAIAAIEAGPPRLRLIEARSSSRTLDSRGVWRAVRATWSMGVESSAPGREVAFVGVDERFPDVPLGIVQFRNVVPEIVARDRWLGITGAFGADGAPRGYLRYLKPPDATDRMAATRAVLSALLAQVNPQGLETSPSEDADPLRLAEVASYRRRAFNDARSEGDVAARSHLSVVKRAETAGDLIRGISALDSLMKSDDPLRDLAANPDALRDLNAGLRKIWHYHMGFVAIEMSICGAAPPFGPLRVGKLLATTAASQDVVTAWGTDRPLGQIASETYLPSVREAVPNPGPLVVFTSGVYPGHSAQYNRLRAGSARWVKLGETVGYGSFHVSVATSRLAAHYNAAVDGYKHITRSFGEGSSARFRQVGRAISRLELPDLLKHEISRPLYALPLVDDPHGVILGWTAMTGPTGVGLDDLSAQWWHRWVSPQANKLAEASRRSPDLLATLTEILGAARRYDGHVVAASG